MIHLRRALRRSPLLLLAVASFAASALAAGRGDHALLVVDPTDPESMYVANYYRAAREIPDVNFLYVDPDATDYPEFAAVQAPALLGRLYQAGIRDRIHFVIVPPGGNFYVSAPGLLSDACYTPTRISISSAFGLSMITDAILAGTSATRTNHFSKNVFEPVRFDSNLRYRFGEVSDAANAEQYFVGAMLGYTGNLGNTLAEVLDVIDRSVAVDGTQPVGTFYYMQTTDDARSSPRHFTYNNSAAEIVSNGGQAGKLFADLPLGLHDCLGVMTGVASPPIDTADFTLLPGAFADHLTSYAGNFSSSSQVKMSRWISKGASGTSGTVEEPCNYSSKFIHSKFHVGYHQGMTLGEAHFRHLRSVGFQSLLLGDPLTAPWAQDPSVDLPNPPGTAVSGYLNLVPTASATAPGAIIETLELVIDGRHLRWAGPSQTFLLDTTWLEEGWHEMRILATDDTAVGNVGRWIGELEVDNHGRRVTLGASPLTGDLAQPFDFTFAAAGGTVAELRLLHHGRVVASSSSDTGTLRVYGQNLGAGPVRVQAEAVFTDGLVARSAPAEVQIAYAPGAPGPVAPVAHGYSRDLFADQTFTVELPATFDEDPAGLTWTIVTPPAQATLLSTTSGPWRVYQPLPGASGTDSLSFQVAGSGGTSAVRTIDLVYETRPLAATFGCGVNPEGSIAVFDGAPALGRTVEITIDNPLGTQTAGSWAFLLFSNAPDANYPCGTLLPNFGMSGVGTDGELLIDAFAPNPILTFDGGPWLAPGSPVVLSIPIPPDPLYAGFQVWAQAAIVDPSGTAGAPHFALTDAVELTLGHP